MSTSFIIFISLFVIAIIICAWFCKAFIDWADEVVEERRARRRHGSGNRTAQYLKEGYSTDGYASNRQINPSPCGNPTIIAEQDSLPFGENGQYIHSLDSQRQQEESFRRASTGIDFGGDNTDLNLNPSTHFINEEMMDNSSLWSEPFNNDPGWNDPIPDTSWDIGGGFDSFDSGFNDPCNGF